MKRARLIVIGTCLIFGATIGFSPTFASTITHLFTGIWAPEPTYISSSTPPVYATSTSTPASDLPAPTGVAAVAYSSRLNTVLLQWVPVYDAGGYKIVRSGGSGPNITGYSHEKAEWTDTLPWGISSPTDFTYTITTLDQGGNEAPTSTTFIYTATSTPSLPE